MSRVLSDYTKSACQPKFVGRQRGARSRTAPRHRYRCSRLRGRPSNTWGGRYAARRNGRWPDDRLRHAQGEGVLRASANGALAAPPASRQFGHLPRRSGTLNQVPHADYADCFFAANRTSPDGDGDRQPAAKRHAGREGAHSQRPRRRRAHQSHRQLLTHRDTAPDRLPVAPRGSQHWGPRRIAGTTRR